MDILDIIEGGFSLIGNIIFFLLGGFIIAFWYFGGGLVLCATIIGIPFGLQCFKIGAAAIVPFGKDVRAIDQPIGMEILGIILNIIWVFTFGLGLALTHLVLGVLFCLTIIGSPIGSQHFKLMSIAFAPFGKQLV